MRKYLKNEHEKTFLLIADRFTKKIINHNNNILNSAKCFVISFERRVNTAERPHFWVQTWLAGSQVENILLSKYFIFDIDS